MTKQYHTHARAGISALLIGLLTWLGTFGLLLQFPVESSLNAPATPVQLQAREALNQLPLSFEANRGQTDKAVQFISRGADYTLYLAASEARLEPRDKNNPRSSLSLQLAGASSESGFEGEQPLPAHSNYFIGNDSRNWQTDVPHYARVRRRNVYPGIDLVFYGNRQRLEYDFILAPQADPGRIRLAFPGNARFELDGEGNLLIGSDTSTDDRIRLRKPEIYQETGGQRRMIEGGYKIQEAQSVSFELGAYDSALPLVIDPVVEYSTYLGGSGTDIGYGIAVDSQGAIYLTGQTSSLDFPIKNGFRTAREGATDAFVLKLNKQGLVFSTFIGGRNPGDRGSSIAVDKAGNVYFTGETNSGNFPIANAAFPVFRGNGDVFVAKFNIDGNVLLYSTFLGGTLPDEAFGIAVDSFDNAYVTGRTASANFPMKNPIQPTLRGQRDAYVAKFDPDGVFLYSTYLGGEVAPGGSPDDEAGTGIALDNLQNIYITGFTSSPSFPTLNGYQNTFAGVEDAFLAKINSTGSALVYSTYLGGERAEEASALAVDALGNAYVTGYTFSIDFPTTAGVLQRLYGGNVDAFVAKFNATGSALLYSTFLGGNGAENTGLVLDNLPVGSIAVDSLGYAYVTGKTESENFPMVRPLQSSLRGDSDAFIAKIDPAGASLVYSTFWGSSFVGNNGYDERGLDLTLDRAGAVYITGQVLKNDLMTVTPAQMNFGGGLSDAFITKITSPDIATIAPVSAAGFVGASLAPEAIVALFGTNLAEGVGVSNAVPLPTSLLGAGVKVRDRTNTERLAGLFFVSPGQINLQIPPGTATGRATLTATNAQGTSVSTNVLIERTAPGLFSANANGQGVAAAVLVRVKPDGSQIFEPILQLDQQNKYVPLPIDFGPDQGANSDQLFLILFGTGWRGRTAQEKVAVQIGGVPTQVLYAGAQGEFIGEDQINVQLPRALARRGEINISVTVDGQIANLVTAAFR
ncbi:MAG TPA: SBBP repeat-containing protein [Blastocatellia bacterium]|nr:SBBP repeat-containing protein [Blastocatellia bacterium]HMV86232.1 SBBP repeat-containing protein [Blastocatellia bacterium]HMY71526.1 SBBP repeat-containing protein [Blastocatellia bacterium]HNG30157.1 SBBP repeat-containing protein [Blastocatellia bacterium]